MAWQFVVLTTELRADNDTTMTVEYLTWPWWAAATLIISMCVPIQAVVCYGQLTRALTGAGPGGFVEPDVEDPLADLQPADSS